MRKLKLFMLVKVEFEKQIFAIQKKWKSNVWSLAFGQKMKFK